jgi:nucleoside-diphosphate-sugar epimerase
MRRVPDITKICTKLNFAPQWDLEEGMKKTIEWQKQFIDL